MIDPIFNPVPLPIPVLVWLHVLRHEFVTCFLILGGGAHSGTGEIQGQTTYFRGDFHFLGLIVRIGIAAVLGMADFSCRATWGV